MSLPRPHTTWDAIIDRIRAHRAQMPCDKTMIVAVSGIDASGKGFLSRQLQTTLKEHHSHTAILNVDGWLQLPSKRFASDQPGEHFYHHGIRFDELFQHVVIPLRNQRSLQQTVSWADPTNREQYDLVELNWENLDILILEGIFLLKSHFASHYDFKLWIDCTFETALKRALKRNQEGLPESELIRDYEQIYFPAQRIHLDKDQPLLSADAVFNNDSRNEPQMR